MAHKLGNITTVTLKNGNETKPLKKEKVGFRRCTKYVK